MVQVILKIQRPLYTNGSKNEVMSYIVDENDERISNPAIESMTNKDIKRLFGDHYKVYYLAEYTKGKKTLIKKPTWEDEWV